MRRLTLAIIGFLLISLACGKSQVVVPTPGTVPASFNLKWEYKTAPFLPLSMVSDALGRPDLYVAQQNGGLLILDISSNPPTKIGNITKAKLAGLAVMYVTQQGTDLYLALGNLFDSHGSKSGLAIADIADPTAPKVLSVWTSDVIAKGSSFILTEGNYAYLAAMSAGLDIFDISDPTQIKLVATIQPDVNFPKANPTQTEYPNARGLAIHDNLLYLADDAGGLRVIDIHDQNHPKEVGRYINAGVGKKQQAYNNIAIHWPYAYLAVDYCGLEVLDLQKAQSIRQVGWWNPWNCQSPSNLWLNSPGQTNQLAYDAQEQRVYLSAGDSELQVVDVSNPEQPHLAETFGKPKDGLGAWGVTVSTDTIYLSYITSLIPFKGTWDGIKAISR